MDFDSFLNQAWDEHATDAAGVAQRLAASGPSLVTDEAQIAPLGNLVHHVYGEHLGRWAEGLALLHRLAKHPACSPGGAARRRWPVSRSAWPCARAVPTNARR